MRSPCWQIVVLLLALTVAYGIFHRGHHNGWFRGVKEEKGEKRALSSCISIRGGSSDAGKENGAIKVAAGAGDKPVVRVTVGNEDKTFTPEEISAM
eukprot:gene33664-40726_t